MSKINKSRFAVLGFLAIEPASGYDLKKAMEQSTDYFWREGDGSIYPVLKQLLNEGLVSCEIINEASQKPKKRYSITPSGRAELIEWLEAEPTLWPTRNELLLKIFFGNNVEPQVIMNHIENFKGKVQARFDKYESIVEIAKDKFSVYQFLTLKSGIANAKAALQWCDEALELLKNECK